jgi:hypothetical protein
MSTCYNWALGHRLRTGEDSSIVNLDQIVADLQAKSEDLQKELHCLDAALRALEGVGASNPTHTARLGHRRSAAVRKRMSDAQKARWAKYKRKRRSA